MVSMGLANGGIFPAVLKLAKKAGAKVTRVTTYGDFEEFKRNSERSFSSVACMEVIVSVLERNRDDVQRLANAWSVGDIPALRALVPRLKSDECSAALYDNEQNAKDMVARHTREWLAAAEDTLRANTVSLAIVSMEDSLRQMVGLPRSVLAATGWRAARHARTLGTRRPVTAVPFGLLFQRLLAMTIVRLHALSDGTLARPRTLMPCEVCSSAVGARSSKCEPEAH